MDDMVVAPRIVARLADVVNGWLPAGYSIAFDIPSDYLGKREDVTDATPSDDAEIARGSFDVIRHWRRQLSNRSARGGAFGTAAATDLAALPSSGNYILAELTHTNAGGVVDACVIRCFAWDTIRDLVTDPALTDAQKRTRIRNALASMLSDCQARVAANQ
jgi:hypothetical protein